MARPPLGVERWGKINARCASPGLWVANAWYRDSMGRRRRMQRSGRNQTIARQALDDALHETLRAHDADTTPATTLATLADVWWEAFSRGPVVESTLHSYDRQRLDIVRTIGGMRVREVTVPWLDRYFRTLDVERGPSVAKRHRVILSHMLDLALRHGAVAVNPVAQTRLPHHAKAAVVAPTLAAIEAMRDAFATSDLRLRSTGGLRDYADVLVATGARTSEVLALHWADVDLEAGAVTIRATLAPDLAGRTVRQERTKTDAGYRRLLLPDDAIATLLERRTRSASEWVFPARGGGMRSAANLRRTWRDALAGTPHEGTTPKGYRKAVATAIAAELGSEAAAQQLGHTSDATTKAHYIERLAHGPDARAVLERLRQSGE
jgi:integrase